MSSGTIATAPPTGLPRLLPPDRRHPPTLAAHVQRYGSLPRLSDLRPDGLIATVGRSGLRGRGGAGFPTATKLAAVAARRRTVVVANGCESEPASAKDRTLITSSPHLVLDGVAVAALTVRATEAVVCVHRHAADARRSLEQALAERQSTDLDPVPVRVATPPGRYVAGEESALVQWLNGGDAKPTFVPPRPFERGVGGRPTLVDNVETLANLALIARYGDAWFRTVGTGAEPGSALVTVSGAVGRPGVFEVAFGTPVLDLLGAANTSASGLSAVLIGGYFGHWVAPSQLPAWRLVPTSMGAGVIVALPVGTCGLAELARVGRYLAGESAGQCGPCVFGLDAIAGGLEDLARGVGVDRAWADLHRWVRLVQGRGACHHPDGAAGFVASGLTAFAAEIEAHRVGRCHGRDNAPVLPVPRVGGWR